MKKNFYNPILHYWNNVLYWTDFYGGIVKKYEIPLNVMLNEVDFDKIIYKEFKLGECELCLWGSSNILLGVDGFKYVVIHNKNDNKCLMN